MDGARPLVDRGSMTDLEVVIQEVLQDKIAIDYEASGLARPEDVKSIGEHSVVEKRSNGAAEYTTTARTVAGRPGGISCVRDDRQSGDRNN